MRLLLDLPLADAAARHIFDAPERAAAPDLINAEILHTIRRYERRAELDRDRSAEAIADLLQLPILRYPTLSLAERAWHLRDNFTAYDAMYVALAEALETSLVTSDAALARAARAHAAVEVVHLA